MIRFCGQLTICARSTRPETARAQVPLAFMTRKWRLRVRPDGINIDLRAWQVAVLVHLRERLRAGDIWVDGSRAWRSSEDYL